MRAYGLVLASVLLTPALAEAQLVVVPPVVSDNAKAWERNIGAEILKKVDAAEIPRIKLKKPQADEMRTCKNTLSCLGERAQAMGATHFLHTIVGRRGNEVKVQFTLVEIATTKPLAQLRVGSLAKKGKVLAAIRGGMNDVLLEVVKVPALRPGGAAEPLATYTPPTPEPAPTRAREPERDPLPEIPIARTRPVEAPPVQPAPEPAAQPKPAPEPAPRAELRTRPEPGLVAETSRPSAGPNWLAWGTMGGGVAVAGAGVLMLALASSDIGERNETPQVEAARRQELTDSAGMKQNLGVTFLVAGGAAIATGAVFHVLGIGARRSGASASWQLAPNGLHVTF